MLAPVPEATLTLTPTALLAAGIAFVVPVYAWRERGRPYGVAALVILALSFPAAGWVLVSTAAAFPGAKSTLALLWTCGFAAAGLHLASLVRARLRPRWFRWGVSIPGMTFIAAGALALPWCMVFWPVQSVVTAAVLPSAGSALGWIAPLPFYVALLSVPTSLGVRREFVRIDLGGPQPATLGRLPVQRSRREPAPNPARGLRVVQIADPHLGPWQPIHRLRARLESLLRLEPDLVLLTGDFLTMEGRGSPGALGKALAPLSAWRGRCFAIFGNHDHEAPEEVRAGLDAAGVRLLVDEEACVETARSRVQIIGSDWRARGAGAHLRALLARHPRRSDHLRLLLLHDPSGFVAAPKGDVDLALSGHTHGGQLGLLSFGLPWTVLSRSRWPDHGLFAHGSNRLYVHRGTGFYGFPLRVGVPGEASLLEVVGGSPGAGA